MKEPLSYRNVGDFELIEVAGDPKKETILLLHGFGADASDLVPLSQIYPEGNWIFPRGPLSIPFSQRYVGRAWFPINMPLLSQAIEENRSDEIAKAFPPEIKESRTLIDRMIIDLKIPRSKLILGGFSQGAVLATETTLNSDERLAALLIFSGTLINEENWRRRASHHVSTPFFQSHGSGDSILPIDKAEALFQILKIGGLKGDLHRFHGGHEIPHSILQKLRTFLTTLI